MAALEPISQTRRDMQQYIEQHIPEQLFRDGLLHKVELNFKDINLELYIKNNKCAISSFSRGRHIIAHPERQQLRRIPREHEETADRGDGAIFLALVVVYCNEIVPIEWIANNMTDWTRIEGICTPQTCRELSVRNYAIDNAHFVTWANTVLGTRGGTRYKKTKQKRKKNKKTKTKRKY
jgi:hypothetical protein